MDIEKQHEKLGFPLLITFALLTMIPLSTSYIDCRISCRRCHENTEHPSVLEVYCAMCEECKQRRRERMQGRSTSRRTTAATATPLVRMRDGLGESAEALAKSLLAAGSKTAAAPSAAAQQAQPGPQPPQSQQTQQAHHPPKPAQRGAYRGEIDRIYPAGCPTPPMCSDSEETELLVLPSTTTTTTTTTTQPTPPPCPPVHKCRKKKTMMPCMPCMPMCPCPMYSYPQAPVMLTQPATSPASLADYHYVYIGLPKNVMRSN